MTSFRGKLNLGTLARLGEKGVIEIRQRNIACAVTLCFVVELGISRCFDMNDIPVFNLVFI